MRKRTQARECAIQILYQREMNDSPLDEILVSFWEQHPGFLDETKDFTRQLVMGTVEHLPDIDEIITRYTENWGLGRMAVIDRNILRFATYELLYASDIPPKVTINEAVNIAKKFSQEESGKFVNGVLDKISHSENIKKSNPA
ncbi:MAG: transcription antitermination factor NusB [Candidatus Omnitrophica bacterium]|nr:transcription antitermination factor NusB [Candidatus Omnitrophota bacterium]